MIEWNKYFDHIFILSRCSNFERRERLNKELKRIGLYDYVTYLYQPDSKLLNYNSSLLPETTFRCKNAHYTCIKMAYELNYDNICIMEDDIVFLKSLDTIHEQLEIFQSQKNSCSIYLFNYASHDELFNSGENRVLYLADCYWLNRHGMKYMIYILENFPNLTNDSLFYTDLNKRVDFSCNVIVSDSIIQFVNIPEDTNILPISIKKSPIKLTIQYLSNNDDIYNYFKTIDLDLYNTKI